MNFNYYLRTLQKIKVFIGCGILLAAMFIFSQGVSGAPATLDADEFYRPLEPLAVHVKTSRAVVKKLKRKHYRQVSINDQLSSEMLDNYLSDLDPTRSYFMINDISDFERYRYQLDDALQAGNLEPAFKIFNRYQQRRAERLVFLINRLAKGLDSMNFESNETLATDRSNAFWPASTRELDALWLKKLKNRTLSLKLSDKSLDDITELLTKQFRNQLNRLGQTTSEDVFQVYINALAQSYDPHTQYFSPRTSKNFDINLSLSLEGIGAYLKGEDEYTKVVRLVPAGPADKSKLLKPGDRIIGVGEGLEGEIVNVIGWRLDDVVELIRGPKKSLVQLEIIPVEAEDEQQTKVIKIVRNTVKLEEQSAHKDIIDLDHNEKKYKVGIIDIPAFYLNFKALKKGDPLYTSTTRDVQQLLKELITEQVSGIIIDLRSNSGGALQEATALVGLFVEEGPIVQVRNTKGRVEVLRDSDPEIIYNGPLAVVVNRLSASASEIFAAAIQDYRRGIIIGEQTFGKGTVQSLIPLSRGQLKATQAKFYRITGASTQNKGIIPDISYPSLYDVKEIGESALPDALPWDEIAAVDYTAGPDLSQTIAALREQHQQRIQQAPDYIYLLDLLAYLKEAQQKTEISLKETVRKKEREDADKRRLAIENKLRIAKNQEPLEKISELKQEETPETEDPDDTKDDPLLHEAGHILIDFIELL